MTSVTLQDFAGFFAAAHGGARPFPWQRRLVEQLIETGKWPEQVSAPTGSGKTAVIDAHVFAVAAMADGEGAVVPRRLALVVPRRVLVDSQYNHARYLARLLNQNSADQPRELLRVANALRSLRWSKAPEVLGPDQGSPLVVARLRGALPPPKSWRNDPVACAVLSCTPDMWGSRLLLRGYGSSHLAWPREAGLLGLDAVVVVDEAHLCRQLVTSARSVAALQRKVPTRMNMPMLQVVEATATPGGETESILGVNSDDFDTPLLARRLGACKPVEIVRIEGLRQATVSGSHIQVRQALANSAIGLHEKYGSTVGVFVNTVSMATDVAQALRTVEVGGRNPNVVLICGRLRAHDVKKIQVDYPGLLSLEGNRAVDILVATQSLEVGVDIDLVAAVSELAPGGALAQRVGRVNRLGQRDQTRFVVVCPENAGVFSPVDENGNKVVPLPWKPYDADELSKTFVWLEEREKSEDGLAPRALASNPPPPAAQRRRLYQRVELADTWWWARTSDEVDPLPELDLWLDDSLDADIPEVGIVVRRAIPVDPLEAIRLLRALPPQDHEIFPVLKSVAGNVLEKVLSVNSGTILLVSGKDVTVISKEDDRELRRGDIIVFDDTVRVFTEGVVANDGREAMPDVLEAKFSPGRGDVFLRIDNATWPDGGAQILMDCAALLNAGGTSRKERDALADLLADVAGERQMVAKAAALLGGPIKGCDIIPFYADERLVRVVISDQRRAVSDDGICQTWTPSESPVLLDQHSKAVGDRAASIAQRLGLSEAQSRLLELAGLHHDDGKADLRWQASRAGAVDLPLLAKSWKRISTQAEQMASALPSRWRHEQLSVLEAWEDLASLSRHDRELVLRLIGTSHGYGRVSFPHVSSELGVADKHQGLAARLFDEGYWDEIIEQTDRRLGVWGCAFLEALLRAADGQVSAEGS